MYRVFGAKSLYTYSNERNLWEADDSFSGHYNSRMAVHRWRRSRLWPNYDIKSYCIHGLGAAKDTIISPSLPPSYRIHWLDQIRSAIGQEGIGSKYRGCECVKWEIPSRILCIEMIIMGAHSAPERTQKAAQHANVTFRQVLWNYLTNCVVGAVWWTDYTTFGR